MSWVFYEGSFSKEWAALVEAHEKGRFVHLIGFQKAIVNGYRLKPLYLAYLEKQKVLGLFPGFFHQSWLFGKRILSQPFSEYGGLLLQPELPPGKKRDMAEQFLGLMKRVMNESGYHLLEMRHPADVLELKIPDFQPRKLFRRSWLRLEEPEVFWKKLDPKERNIIRRAQSHQLKIELINDITSFKKKFYPLYLKTMKRLGSPPHPLAYFSCLFHFLSANMKIFVVNFQSIPVSGLIAWAVGKTVQVTDMVSDDRYFFVKPNDLAIWEFLKWAWQEGYQQFDFGPVRYRGQEIFKKKWLMNLEDYYYVHTSADGQKLLRIKHAFSENSIFLRYAPFIWKNFLPLPLTPIIGKYFRRQIGL